MFATGGRKVFELGGKRSKRVAVAELKLRQIRAQITAFDRSLAVEIRAAYGNATAAVRQHDILEKLIAADEEIIRASEARLKEGDVAPLDINLLKVEPNDFVYWRFKRKANLT